MSDRNRRLVGIGAPVAVASGMTSYTVTGLASGTPRYFKVTAVGSSQESADSDVYGATSHTPASSVLIVDGNDADAVYAEREQQFGADVMRQLERTVVLSVIDNNDHTCRAVILFPQTQMMA